MQWWQIGFLSGLGGSQRLVQISDDILGVLQSDGDPDEVVGYPELNPFRLLDGGMSHGQYHSENPEPTDAQLVDLLEACKMEATELHGGSVDSDTQAEESQAETPSAKA